MTVVVVVVVVAFRDKRNLLESDQAIYQTTLEEMANFLQFEMDFQ